MRTIHVMLASLALALSGPLTAATIVVDTVVDIVDETDGACSLREALINAANNNDSGSRDCAAGGSGADTILFNELPTNATITLTGGVLPTITGDLEILGPDPDNPGQLVIDAQNASRIFEVTGGRLTVSGLTLTNGRTDKEDEPGGAMHISGGADVSLQDLFISDSATEGVNSPGGAIYAVNAAQLTLSNVQLVRNQAQAASGGAIFVTGTPLSVVDSVLGQNAASGRGGAIHAVGNQASITDSVLVQNSTSGDSSFGGALFMDGTDLVMSGTELSNNATSGVNAHGGAVYLRNATLTVNGGIFDSNGVSGSGANGDALSTLGADVELLNGCQFVGNTTLQVNGLGGAMRIGTGNLEMDNCSVSNNRTQGENAHGGAIYVITGNATILNSQIVDNETQGAGAQGGGIRVRDGNLTVENSLVQNNSTSGAGARGGGIYHRNGQSRLTRVEVISNTTAGLDAHGAGVYLLESDLDLELGRIENNRIDGNAVGAGMGLFSGNFVIDGVTFSANRGTGSGGAIHVADGPLRIVNSTISANEVSTGTGSAVFGNRSDVELLHVTVVDNINPPGNLSHLFVTGSEPDARASLTLNNSLVIGNRCGAGTLSALNVAGSLVTDASCTGQVVPTEALAIEPLADNGGFAPTHALSAGSIAVDAAGNCPVDFSVSQDQRGLPRPGGSSIGCDVGAYERQSPQDPVDLQASVLINPAAAQVGQTLSVIVDITNPSTRWASGVEVGLDIGNALLIQNADFSVGEIDAGFETWTIGLLAPQQTVSLALIVQLAASGSREVVISLIGYQPDPDPGNNLVSQTVLEAQPSGSLLVDTLEDTQLADGLCSLREAMFNAHNADQSGSIDCATGGFESNTITFDPSLSGGTIALSGQQLPAMASTIEILGPVSGDPTGLTIDAGEQSRHFEFIQAGSIRLADLSLVNGRVINANGGSIRIDRVNEAVLERLVLNGNTVVATGRHGGAVFAAETALTFIDSLVDSNVAGGRGGGLYLADSTMDMSGSTFTGNESTRGGGLYLLNSPTEVRNTTVSGNRLSTAGNGSGLTLDGSPANLIHVTISANQGQSPGTPGLQVTSASGSTLTVHLDRSLVVDDRCRTGTDAVIEALASVATHVSCGAATAPAGLIDLQPLADNGGSTPTHALGAGSIAIDAAGACAPGLELDQRGQVRPGGSTSACDAGAYEFQGDAPIADARVSISADREFATVGQRTAFTLEVTNAGPDANLVEVEIDWPAGLAFFNADSSQGSFDDSTGRWSIGGLAPSQTASLTLSLEATALGPQTVTATLGGSADDPDPANDLAQITLAVVPDPSPIVVTTLEDRVADDGACSLREAILNANGNDQSGSVDCGSGSPIFDEIFFAPALADGVLMLDGASLPTITDTVMIYGPVPDRADRLTIDGGGQVRIVRAAGADVVSFEAISFIGGRAGPAEGGGGALLVEGVGELDLRRVRLIGNRAQGAEGHGGAVRLVDVNVSLQDCELSDNLSEQGHGGAIHGVDTAIRMESCLLADNEAPAGVGGAIHSVSNPLGDLSSAILSIDTSTLSGNRAVLAGGLFIDGGRFDLEFVSLIDNRADSGAADLVQLDPPSGSTFGTSALRYSLIAQSEGAASCQFDDPLLVDIDQSVGTDSACVGVPIAWAALALGPLADNGGMTRTHALAEGSLALDAADCPVISRDDGATPVDQRGQPRPGGGSARCDAGAYERQGAVGDRIFGDGFEAVGQ